MQFLYTFLLFLILFSSNAICDTNTSLNKNTYIDNTHTTISKQMHKFSAFIDSTLYDWIENIEDTTNDIENKEMSMDVFFKNEKYIDYTDDAFVRLRLNSYFQSKGDNDYTYALKAHLPLSRSKKKLNLFVKSTFKDDDETDKEVYNLSNNPNDKNPSTEVGINYFSASTYNVKPKFSAGIRRLDPFVRARFKMKFEAGKWNIELSQLFKYTLEDKFSEKTKLYFDRKLEDLKLFRIVLHRDTADEDIGMDYGIGFHYYISRKKKSAIRISQTFNGNTEYRYKVGDSTDLTKTKKYQGINNYTTSLSWRENILKDWIFYEVTPSANFYKNHALKENYSLSFLLEFYFGDYKNK